MSQIDDLEVRLKAYVDDKLDAHIAEAFVDGPQPHKTYHSDLVDEFKARKKFWNAVLENIVGGVAVSAVVAFLGFLGWALMLWLKEHLK